MDGAAIVVSDLDEAGGYETVHDIERNGGRAAFFRADVRSESQIKQLVSFAEMTFGGLSVLVNNASAPRGGAGIDSWMDTIETDLPELSTPLVGQLKLCGAATVAQS